MVSKYIKHFTKVLIIFEISKNYNRINQILLILT